MAWLISTLGAGLVALMLGDVFHTLFHPGGQGGISRFVLSATWRTAGRLGGPRRFGELAGPVGVVAVIATWAGLVVLGGALVYWPHVPDGVSYGTGLEPGQRNDFMDALYLSMVTTTTLGFGDIVPTAAWLRAVVPLQALIGFILLTAAVSWVLQVYPALNRRRMLAARLTSLRRSGTHDAVRDGESVVLAVVLEELAGQVTQASVDLTQYAETYYFRDRNGAIALPVALPYAVELAETGLRSGCADIRLAATHLGCAIEDLTRQLGREFLETEGTPREVIAAYARDHGQTDGLRRHPDGGPPGPGGSGG